MSFDETHMPGFNIGAAEIQADDDWEETKRHVSIVKVRGVETNERQIGGGFSGRVTALFASLLLAAQKFHLRWITITTGSGRFYSPSDRRILLRRSARDYRSIRISILRLNATEAKNGIRRGEKTLRLEYQVVFGYTICSLKYTDRPFFFLPFPLCVCTPFSLSWSILHLLSEAVLSNRPGISSCTCPSDTIAIQPAVWYA